jgi:hypothetical protein
MAIPWATNLLHFHLNKPFKKRFLIWHYFIWHLFWLLFKKLGDFFQIIWSPCLGGPETPCLINQGDDKKLGQTVLGVWQKNIARHVSKRERQYKA